MVRDSRAEVPSGLEYFTHLMGSKSGRASFLARVRRRLSTLRLTHFAFLVICGRSWENRIPVAGHIVREAGVGWKEKRYSVVVGFMFVAVTIGAQISGF